MAFYSVCGLKFDSSEQFPELTPISEPPKSGEITKFRRVSQLPEMGPTIRAATTWTTPAGIDHLFAFKTEKGYLLRFAHLADFFLNPERREISFCALPDTPLDSIRHLFLDGVVPLMLSLQGRGVLHASAIRTTNGVAAFLGETGAGKSTLAGSFQQSGCPVITDDCLLLEAEQGKFYARPSYPGIRLRADSLSHLANDETGTLSVAHYNSKRRLSSGQFTEDRETITAIYCLQRVEQNSHRMDPVIEALSGHHRLIEVLRYLYCLDPHDSPALREQFKLLENLAVAVPVFRLRVPAGFRYLPQVRETVLAHLAEISESQPKDEQRLS